MKLRVTVTQDDIDSGCTMDGTNCAIARAIERLFEKKMWVCHFGICPAVDVEVSEEDVLFRIPEHVVQWIKDFDHGKPVKPITFEIEPTARPEAAKCAEEMVLHTAKVN